MTIQYGFELAIVSLLCNVVKSHFLHDEKNDLSYRISRTNNNNITILFDFFLNLSFLENKSEIG